MSTRKRPMQRLQCLALEDRTTPALTGVPWADPSHLTMSFAPDGTSAGGLSSQMFSKLNTLMSQETWQGAIYDAVQAWATVSGANVGLTTDTGAAFGSTGPTQADSRFGDIRFAAVPMSTNTYAEAIPPDPYLSGTFAGDIVLNTNIAFTPVQLKAVVLHEMGHALGLEHSTDPQSVMYRHLNTTPTLAASDLTAVRALYGTRVPDLNEESNGNHTLNTATHLQFHGGFDGQIPIVAWGDITTVSDVDIFELNVPSNYYGPVTVRVQTTGISLLAAKVRVLNENGTTLLTASNLTDSGATITLTLPSVNPSNDYFIRIEAAPEGTKPVGRYGVAVTMDTLLQPTVMTIDQVLRGPYESVKNGEVAELFLDPTAVLFNDDLHGDDSPLTAQLPYSQPGHAANTLYRMTGSLTDATDTDFYKITAPSGTGTWNLTALVNRFGPNGLVPRVQVLSASLTPIATTILANGNGHFAVQAVNLAPAQVVYLKILPNGAMGNYDLEARFNRKPVQYTSIASGSLTASEPQSTFTLQAAHPALLGLSLAATGTSGGVRMTLVNSSTGATLMDLTAMAGDTVSGISLFLPVGQYELRVTAVAGASLPLNFSIQGSILTDPVGPVASDPTLSPSLRKQKNNPPAAVAIDGITFLDPFLWLISLAT